MCTRVNNSELFNSLPFSRYCEYISFHTAVRHGLSHCSENTRLQRRADISPRGHARESSAGKAAGSSSVLLPSLALLVVLVLPGHRTPAGTALNVVCALRRWEETSYRLPVFTLDAIARSGAFLRSLLKRRPKEGSQSNSFSLQRSDLPIPIWAGHF